MTDLRYAFRMLLKSPGFSLIAILTLALGIGANSAIFSVIDTVLLRPLPFPQPNELAMLWSAPNDGADRETNSFPDYEDFREQAKSFQSLAAYVEASTVLNTSGDPIELQGLAATSDIFSVLGVSPMLGRAYARAEDSSEGACRHLHLRGLAALFQRRSQHSRPPGAAGAQPLHGDWDHAARIPIPGRWADRISHANAAVGGEHAESSRRAFHAGCRPVEGRGDGQSGAGGSRGHRRPARTTVSRHE